MPSGSLAAVPAPFAIAWFTVVGAVVGSFLNVVIARVPAGESIVRPASRCPRCLAPIAWYDNVPVLSWLVLRARCRRCGAPISFRYPAVELLVAAAGFLAAWRHGLSAEAALELAFVAALLALAFIDADTWSLPYPITLPLLAVGLAAAALGHAPADGWRSSLLGAGVGFAAFGAIWFVSDRILKKEAMGLGDVWLLAGIGAWLGVAALLPVILLASLLGSVGGALLLLVRRREAGVEALPPPAPVAGGAPAGEAPPAPAPEPEPVPEPQPPPEPEEVPGPAADAPAPAAAAADDEWIPPPTAIPFGPFLVAGALQWLYLAELLGELFPPLRVFR